LVYGSQAGQLDVGIPSGVPVGGIGRESGTRPRRRERRMAVDPTNPDNRLRLE
jgi:hypothetical protein